MTTTDPTEDSTFPATGGDTSVEIRRAPFDHPDAVPLLEQVQQEYVVRYGTPDATPVDPAEFAPPRGVFLVAYVAGAAMACGGWRAHDGSDPEFRHGDVEIKRMYVAEQARGRGLARAVLADLEHRAAGAGYRRMVLETGLQQPEAITLYRSSGYTEIEKFGVYRDDADSLCLAKALPLPGLLDGNDVCDGESGVR